MKGLKAISAIVVLSFMVVSQKANAQIPGIDIKPQIQLPAQKLQIETTPNTREDDQKALIYLQKGIKLFQAEKYQQAIPFFSEVIKIQPNNQYAYFFRGVSYFQLEKYQQAKVDLDKSIELDDSISYSYYFRGITNYLLGNKNSAISDLQTAAKLFDKEKNTQMAKKSRDVIEYIRIA
ncbi:MAG: tetratricopeptide repeat protein [Cyanobacteriota bacterium]|nr:tetratricopeptide repeat protein [Cyanobacteriota bacterium]